MDTGAKTLAQLSEENKEKKYVTLDTGAKISGYTKDYLERLCRLNKVEYRLWSNGNLVIELESLLRETQAILLSYEGITFVDRNELTDPVPQMVGNILSSALKQSDTTVAVPITSYEETPAFKSGIAQSVPTFGKTISEHATPVSFVGRAVVSDALHPEEKMEKIEKKVENKIETKKEPTPPAVKAPEMTTDEHKQGETATHVPIAKFNLNAIRQETSSPVPEKTVAEKVREHIPVVAVNSASDWDEQLLGGHLPNNEVPRHVQIMTGTSPEMTLHAAESRTLPPPPLEPVVPIHVAVVKEISTDNNTFIPPSGQKVIVFSANQRSEETVPPAPDIEEKVEAKKGEIAPAPVMEATPLPPLIAPQPRIPLLTLPELPLLTATPELNVPVPKKELPAKENPPLPMVGEGHHLTPYETHPLMKSTGFNMVFAAMLIASSFVMLGGKVMQNVGGRLNTAEYIAGVGAAVGLPTTKLERSIVGDERAALKKGERAMLPFSNDIVATSGKEANSIIIRPVFESGPGKAYQYILVPEGDSTNTPSTQ